MRAFFLLLLFRHLVCATDSAWNGFTSPGSATPSAFTPYYVPDGTTSYDSSSPFIHTSGTWNEVHSDAYTNGSALETTSKGSYLSLDFTGTGIEVYGGIGKKHGQAQFYVDNSPAQNRSSWSSQEREQQLLFFSYNLSPAKHTIKVVNIGSSAGSQLDIDAFVVTDPAEQSAAPSASQGQKGTVNAVAAPPASQLSSADQWTLLQRGSTGVSAMQIAIISPSHAIIIDKVEHNPLTIDGHPAWGALYNLDTHAVKALNMQSNSFCAGGTFLSNGTLLNVGGNPVVSDNTSSADFGDADGLQAVRMFHPCETENVDACDIYENHARIRLASPRWYNTVIRIDDGSAMIIGGSKKGGWMNNATTNNPTVEYYPPKNVGGMNGLPVQLPFLNETLNSNLFPIAILLPDGTVFLAANQDATIYNWKENSERRLPRIPNGVRVTYPMTGTGTLLPLSPQNNYTAEVLLCGGSAVDDTKPGYEISSQDAAATQCSRMVLSDAGIAAGWQTEEMPQARIMPDAVLLPTGKVLIVNGGASGISGYSNVIGQVGQSNADNPVYTPVLYDPTAPSGSRFDSAGLPASQIPRLYHSVATLTPNADIMIAGSNPNLDRSEVRYGTEYRVEWLGPPYMTAERPTLYSVPNTIGFGEQVQLQVRLPSSATSASSVQVACMDLGYVTHAVHASARLVYLTAALSTPEKRASSSAATEARTLMVTGPPNGGVYPPGPAWLYLVVDGIPSVGARVMIGDGKGPEVDEEALKYVLDHTQVDQYEKDKKSGDDGDSE